jgi:TetR/AcrR family transcriptional repressor of nem operon
MASKSKGEMTRARVLETAWSLVNTRGFNITSINDIIQATGVKKGNLYFHFPSKEDLGLAILQEAKSDFLEFLSNSLQGERPLEKLSNFFDAVLEKHRKTNFVGGCIFGNTALEMSDNNPRFSNLIKEVFRQWTAIITELLIEAREAGDLKQEISPPLLSKQIVASIEGGIMMARLSKNEDDLQDCLKSLRTLLGI